MTAVTAGVHVTSLDGTTAVARSAAPIERHWGNLLEAVPDAMMGLDPAGRIVFANRAAEAMFRYLRDELMSKPCAVLVPGKVGAFPAKGQQDASADQPWRFEAMGRRKDGGEFPVEVVYQSVEDAEPPLVAVVLIRDLTELKQWEAVLKFSQRQMEAKVKERTVELAHVNEELAKENAERSRMETLLKVREERYRLLVETSGVIPWEIDLLTNRLTYIGPQAVRIFGYLIENWYEKDFWFDHLHPEDRKRAIEFYASKTVLTKSHEFVYRFLAADGRIVWVHDVVTVISCPERGAHTLMGVMVDITPQKELEAVFKAEKEEQERLVAQLKEAQNQLVQSEKMASIGQLAAGVAHEINNPVGFVNSNLSTLQGYVRDLLDLIGAYEQLEVAVGEPSRVANVRELKTKVDLHYLREDIFNLLGESQEGLTRVKKIVQDLKEFSHVGRTEMQWTDLHRGLDSTLNIVHNEMKYKAEVVKEYGDLPQVECVASQLNQVFMNLLVNAAHAIEKHGVITVRTGARDGWVWVEVADTGVGIPPANMSKLFDPFFTTKPVGKGTGLGLSLSYGIINKLGGRIEVKSEVGKGSTFRVWLPASQSGREAACP